MLDYSDRVVITITKAKFRGDDSHWEYSVADNDEGDIAAGTGPSFYSALDGALEYIQDEMRDWIAFDANERNR